VAENKIEGKKTKKLLCINFAGLLCSIKKYPVSGKSKQLKGINK